MYRPITFPARYQNIDSGTSRFCAVSLENCTYEAQRINSGIGCLNSHETTKTDHCGCF